MSKYTGYTDKQNKATQKHKALYYERIVIDVRKGVRDVWKEYARQRGMSLQAYIASLVEADNPVPGEE